MVGRLTHDVLLCKNRVNNVLFFHDGLADNLDRAVTPTPLVNTPQYCAKCALAEVGDKLIICG